MPLQNANSYPDLLEVPSQTQSQIASTPSASGEKSIRRKLGRGLGSLLSAPVRIEPPLSHPQRDGDRAEFQVFSPPRQISGASAPVPASTAKDAGEQGDRILMVPLGQITPSPHQPRQHFDDDALKALAESIATSGMMQPIVVRANRSGEIAAGPAGRTTQMTGAAGGYQIIAGERRWRAAQLVGLATIPAVVRDVDDQTAAEFSLIENIQREDLNPMERAEAFARLIDEFQLTHEDIARRVGLNRSSISNHLRLLELDEFCKDAVRRGAMTFGQGKALLACTNFAARRNLAVQALRQEWSVRELERRAKTINDQSSTATGEAGGSTAKAPQKPGAIHTADLERRLGEHLGTKVHLHTGRNKGAGKLVLHFYSFDQFEGLLRKMQFSID